MTREQYERALARRRAKQMAERRRKRIKTAIFLIIVFAVVILATVLILKHNNGYKDPGEIFSTLETAPPVPSGITNTPPSDQPSEADSTGKISFIACGDNLIHEGIFKDAQNRAKGGEKYNFKDMYAGVADIIAKADLAYINQETPMAEGAPSGYPSFNTPRENGDTLVDLGFDIVNIATNHMLDMGTKGLAQSVAYWKTKNVTLLGAFTESDFDNIRVTEKNGIKIAWLSYTYGTNGYVLDASSDMWIPYIDQGDIIRQAALAKQMGDIVIASMHWGTDSAIPVDDSQKKAAQILADCEVDVIIGTHSHTLQPVEYIKSSDGSHETLCYYSLGNLISSMLYYDLMVGGIAAFDIVKDANGTRVENPMIIPTMCQYEKIDYGNGSTSFPYNLAVYKLEDYPKELVSKHGAQIDRSFTYDDLIKRVHDAVDNKYLPEFYR